MVKKRVFDCGGAGLCRNGFLTVEGPVYAEPVRELKILINPPLGYTSPYKKEAIGQHIKSPGAGFAQKKW